MSKVYAVRKGRTTGLFSTWTETQASVHGFSGAEYKSFRTKSEAKAFIRGRYDEHSEGDEYGIYYTDGSCSKGIGGTGVVFVKDEHEVYRLFKSIPSPTTNNYCELLALYHAVKDAQRECIVYTDSKYSLKAVTIWYKTWQKNGWKTSSGKKVANQKIIEKIIKILSQKKYIQIQHVYGHQGNRWNELADEIANGARKMQEYKQSILLY